MEDTIPRGNLKLLQHETCVCKILEIYSNSKKTETTLQYKQFSTLSIYNGTEDQFSLYVIQCRCMQYNACYIDLEGYCGTF